MTGVLAPTFISVWVLSGTPVIVRFRPGSSTGYRSRCSWSARPFAEATVLRAAHAYQQATDWHLQRPPQLSAAT